MSEEMTVEVPFRTLPDGRRYLTRFDIEDSEAVSGFYKRFKHCFTHDAMRDYYIFETPT